MEVTLTFFSIFLRWSQHELLVFLNVPLIWGSENSQCFDSKPSCKVVISLQKSHFVFTTYSSNINFIKLNRLIFPWRKKMLSLIMRGKERKKYKCWEKQYAPAFAIHRKLSRFSPPSSLYIFWHLKNGFHVVIKG